MYRMCCRWHVLNCLSYFSRFPVRTAIARLQTAQESTAMLKSTAAEPGSDYHWWVFWQHTVWSGSGSGSGLTVSFVCVQGTLSRSEWEATSKFVWRHVSPHVRLLVQAWGLVLEQIHMFLIQRWLGAFIILLWWRWAVIEVSYQSHLNEPTNISKSVGHHKTPSWIRSLWSELKNSYLNSFRRI